MNGAVDIALYSSKRRRRVRFRYYSYTTKTVSELTGRSLRLIYRDMKSGVLVLDDLMSVCRYIMAYDLINKQRGECPAGLKK